MITWKVTLVMAILVALSAVVSGIAVASFINSQQPTNQYTLGTYNGYPSGSYQQNPVYPNIPAYPTQPNVPAYPPQLTYPPAYYPPGYSYPYGGYGEREGSLFGGMG